MSIPNLSICSPEKFPPAKLPMLPTLSLSMWRGGPEGKFGSRFLGKGSKFLPSGSIALAEAMQRLKIGPGKSVALPAYHCGSMVEPVKWLKSDAIFYSLQEDLSPDLDDLRRWLDSGLDAVVIVHYFGFIQNIEELNRICEQYEVPLIEDCAHAFFGSIAANRPGRFGTYSIASTRKFFPGMDGGVLFSANNAVEAMQAVPQGLMNEAKSVAALIQLAAQSQNLGILSKLFSRLFEAVDWIRRQWKLRVSRGKTQSQPNENVEYRWFDPARMGQSGSAISRILIRICNVNRLVHTRRSNYQRLLDGLSNIPNSRPLYSILPENVVPSVFPLIIERPVSDFPALKNLGVPIWRWEELERSDCKVSEYYRLRLLQLPCHQELSIQHINWIIEQCQNVLGTDDLELTI